MKIAIITRNLPPYPCGISDHTILLAKALEYEGHKVTIIAGRGQVDHNRLIIEDDWSSSGLSHLLTKLEQLDVDHINSNHKDNKINNLKTLCANCHRLKTMIERNNHEKLSHTYLGLRSPR